MDVVGGPLFSLLGMLGVCWAKAGRGSMFSGNIRVIRSRYEMRRRSCRLRKENMGVFLSFWELDCCPFAGELTAIQTDDRSRANLSIVATRPSPLYYYLVEG
jgi:hypothetical protein